jgi:hypothetical protein
MNLLAQLQNKIAGFLTGSCIVLFNPTTPIGTTQPTYTLEELSYQKVRHETGVPGGQGWSYRWIDNKGFVLRPGRPDAPGQHPVGLRRAVYRSVAE